MYALIKRGQGVSTTSFTNFKLKWKIYESNNCNSYN
jgi:hypothetical protein